MVNHSGTKFFSQTKTKQKPARFQCRHETFFFHHLSKSETIIPIFARGIRMTLIMNNGNRIERSLTQAYK